MALNAIDSNENSRQDVINNSSCCDLDGVAVSRPSVTVVDGGYKNSASNGRQTHRHHRHHQETGRRRPKYGRLKRVAVVDKLHPDARQDDVDDADKCRSPSVPADSSIVIVEEQYDQSQDRVNSVAVTLPRTSSTTSSGLFQTRSPPSPSPPPLLPCRLSSYGATAAQPSPPPFPTLSSADLVPAKDAEGAARALARKRLLKQYAKRIVAAAFSTVGALSLMVGYTVLGGCMFMRLEASSEKAVKVDMRRDLMRHVEHLWVVTARLNVLHRRNWTGEAEQVFDQFAREVFLATKNRGYVYDEGEGDDDGVDDVGNSGDGGSSNTQWTFAGSLLYSITVITTIGEIFGDSLLVLFWCTLYPYAGCNWGELERRVIASSVGPVTKRVFFCTGCNSIGSF